MILMSILLLQILMSVQKVWMTVTGKAMQLVKILMVTFGVRVGMDSLEMEHFVQVRQLEVCIISIYVLALQMWMSVLRGCQAHVTLMLIVLTLMVALSVSVI